MARRMKMRLDLIFESPVYIRPIWSVKTYRGYPRSAQPTERADLAGLRCAATSPLTKLELDD